MAKLTRKQQIEALQAKAGELYDEVEAFRDEMQEAFDNMPESLQSSPNGELAEERIDTLDTWLSELENIAQEEVD